MAGQRQKGPRTRYASKAVFASGQPWEFDVVLSRMNSHSSPDHLAASSNIWRLRGGIAGPQRRLETSQGKSGVLWELFHLFAA
jgi:hypothetical protein